MVVKEVLKTCLSLIRLSIEYHRGQKHEKRGFCTGVTDGRMDKPSYRDAFLTGASKKGDSSTDLLKRLNPNVSAGEGQTNFAHLWCTSIPYPNPHLNPDDHQRMCDSE